MDVANRNLAADTVPDSRKSAGQQDPSSLTDQITRRDQRQGALARLGLIALEGAALNTIFDEAVSVIAMHLDADLSKVLELVGDNSGLLLRSGIGWDEGLVGKAIISTDRNSQAGYTLLIDQPVVVRNLLSEPRFAGTAVLARHHVVSGISVVIRGSNGPFGVLSVHTRTERVFSQVDVAFMQSIANILGSAVQRHQTEQHLQDLRETLELHVARRTFELQQANEKLTRENRERQKAEAALARTNAALVQSNRELQDFAYVASHDLQEPLRKIRSFVDLLFTDCSDALDDTGRHYLDRIRSSAARMSDLVRDLLSISRVLTQAQPFEPTDLARVVQEVLSDLEVTIQETGGQIEVGDLPVIEADIVQMRQLFQNLIGNSLKFVRPGQTPRVRIFSESWTLMDGSEAIRVHVEDEGIGFEEKYADKIFTPFLRLHGRSDYPGNGIGLAICRRIVERHNGFIETESHPGDGARFFVTLPTHQLVDPVQGIRE